MSLPGPCPSMVTSEQKCDLNSIGEVSAQSSCLGLCILRILGAMRWCTTVIQTDYRGRRIKHKFKANLLYIECLGEGKEPNSLEHWLQTRLGAHL